MTFEQFIDVCTKAVGDGHLFFEHHFCRERDGFVVSNDYKAHLRGTNFTLWTDSENKVNQFYSSKDKFVNCKNFQEALDLMKGAVDSLL